MQTENFDTNTRKLMQRGDYWLDEVCARHLGVHGRTYAQNDPFFFGRMQLTTAADFAVSELACSAGTAQRRPQHIRSWTHDSLVLYIQRGPGVTWSQRQARLTLRPGDMMVANPDEPYDMATEGDFDLVSFFLPHALLASHLYPGGPDQPRALPADHAAGAMASRFALDLAARIGTLSETEAPIMVDMLARLVAVAAGAAPPVHAGAIQHARLNQAHAYIEQNLHEPGLTPLQCAQAIGVSLRALHLAFEPSGKSFAQVLQQSRLERCHLLLRSQAMATRSVAEIAFACGFGSLAGFYRAFSRAYGATPTDIKARKNVLF